MPQLDPVVTFLSCTRRTLLVLGAALPAFLRSVVAALKSCTPSRSAVCLFALVLFLPSSTDVQAQTAPEITSGGPFTVAEGTTAVTTLTASDEDTAIDQLVWTIPEDGTGGADADQFTLSSAGVLAFSAVKDYENPDDADGDRTYEVTVQVSDGDNPVTADIRVTLQNVLELSTELTGPSSMDYAENGATRVATYIASSPEDNGDVAWSLSGADSGGFSIDGGALRFLSLPDFESMGTDNMYSVTVAASDGISNLTKDVTVTVTDRDEVGALTLSSTVPRLGTALTAAVTDPDGVTAGTVTWEWERSTGPGAWVVIDGATAASYRPTAADTNAFLRVTATYDDEHGSGHSAKKLTSNVVTGPLLTALQVTTDAAIANPARAMNPAFGKETLHYAIGCNTSDTMQVTLRAPSDARVAVDGRVPSGNSTGDMTATVEVTPTSDVPISVTDSNGAHTVYHVHCLNAQFYQIEAGRYAGAEGVFEGLLLFRHAGYLVMMDNNGVPRFRGLRSDARQRTWFFQVDPNGVYRYASAAQGNTFDILDQHLEVIDSQVRPVAPLRGQDQHAFAILPNGNYLLMSYELMVRDLSHLTFTDQNGRPYVTHPLTDSAIQIITRDNREALFTWDSWGKMPLGDCVQHRFAKKPESGYAHLNSLQMVGDHTIVGSFRGCSKVLGIDVTTGAVAWRVGRTNLSDDDWASRDIGPAPLIPVNDPEGEFCGQHSATILPNGHLLLYDNGAVCLINPWKRHQKVGTHGEYSRAVEYALDHDAGEAVFVRDHSLHGNKAAFGYSSGRVVPMDNGDWLISWGRNLRGQPPLEETVTQVDPATGQEKFFIRFTEENTEERPSLTATPVPADALADTPGPLTAEIAESTWNSAAHTGPFDKPKVVVAFSRPVVDFTAATAPVSLTGATLDSVSALVSAGEAANAYLFTLTPGGDGPITFNLVSGRSCASGGICTADGTTLSEVPAPRVIPRASIRLIAAPDALEIREGTTAAYSVVFNENPAELYGVECGDDVWVQVKHAEGTDVTLDRYAHPVSSGDGNCDGGNWSQPKSFQVSADRDDDADKDPLVTLTHEVWNAGAETVLTGPNVTVSIVEDAGEDTEAPRIEGIEITSDPPDVRDVYGIGDEIEVTVTFSETVTVSGSPRVALKVGERDRSASFESVTGADVVFAYTVAVNDSDTDGASIEADSLSQATGRIQDTAGNNAVLTHSAVAADTGQKVDGIKPALASTGGAVANGSTLTLAYSEPLDPSSVPGNDAFTVTGGSETRTVTGVRVSGSAVELTLNPAVEHGETGLRVSYTVPTATGATPIQDTAGNDADRLSNRSVTNVTGDTTRPAVETVRITSNAGSDRIYAVDDPLEVTVTFNETVVVTGTPRLTLNVGGQNRTADYLSVTGAAVKFEYRVSRGDLDRDGVSIDADSLSRGGGTIRDGARNDAQLDHAAVAADSRHKVDGIPPALATTDGAVVNGTTLTLAYSEPLNSSSRPAASAFTVTGGNEARTVTRVQVSGSEVLLTLNPAVTDTESGLRLSYQPGENPIEDTVGNAADGLNNQPVTNNTGDTTGPTVETVRITSNAGSDATYAAGETIEVTVTFSETVVVTGTPRLTLNLGGRSRTANYQDVTVAAVRFEYQVVSGDTAPYGVGIDANRLSGGTIRDGARNNAVRNHAPVAADSRHQVDGVKPALATSDGAVASGTTLTLAYGEPLDSSSVPATDDFTVTGGSETRTVTGVRVSGSAVFLTLSSAVTDGERGLRVSYEPGSDPLQDTAGNDADRLSSKSVTNRTGDTTGPAVSTVRITSSAGSDRTYGVDETIEVTVTFDETVVVTGTPQLTLNLGGRSRMANFRSVMSQAVKFAYRVVPGDNDGDGVSIEGNSLSRGTGTIRDGARNDAQLDHAAVAADARHQVDGILPVLATTDGAVANGTMLTLAYSEPLRSSSRPAASAFTVTGGNETRTVTRVQVSGSAVFLTLSPAVEEGETGLRLSYQPGGNPIRDVVGNDAEALSNQQVTNRTGDTTAPTVETVRITSNAGSDATYAAGETIEVTVTFSETVVVTGTPRLTLNLGGRSRTANYQDVTGAAVRFEYQVVSGDSAAYGVSIDANRLSGGTIRDGARNNAVLSHAPVAADSRHQVDGVKPTLASSDGAVVNGRTLTLAYGEPLDSSSVPATDDFTVTGGSETRTVTGVRVSGNAVFLTLSSAVADGESRLRVNYEPRSNPIQDTAGNDADRLSNRSVTNRTADTMGPAASRVRITSSAGSDRTYGVDETIEVTVTFDETLVITGTPELTLDVGGRSRTAEYRSVSNRAVKFAYRVVTGDNDEDGVSLEANRLSRAGGTIQDGAGNNAVLDHEAVAASSSHKVDAVAPLLALTDPAVVNGATLTLGLQRTAQHLFAAGERVTSPWKEATRHAP